MTRRTPALLVLVGALLGACRSQPNSEPLAVGEPPPTPSGQPASDPASPPPAGTEPHAAPVTPVSPEVAPGIDESTTPQPGGGSAGPGATDATGAQSPVLVAAALGTSRTRIDGCLKSSASREAAGKRFPARRATRSAPRKQVTITPGRGGAIVVHELDHACCLEAKVDTRISGKTVEIVEALSGMPCRCRCHSTLSTDVGLSPGEHEVIVILQQRNGQRAEVHREKIIVGGQSR